MEKTLELEIKQLHSLSPLHLNVKSGGTEGGNKLNSLGKNMGMT